MRILDMLTFSTLVRNRHFGRTAEELSTTQPAISSRLAALESELGHKLIHRVGNNFRLTPEGEEVLRVFQNVLDSMDGLKDTLHNLDAKAPVLLRIGAIDSVAAAAVTGESGEALKARLRTGTVVTNDDRNWELRWSQERKRINLSRAIAVDMESGTVAAQGYRFRVPYGTLLCVSDKPLHGEIKLPGAANAFYDRAVSEHLMIGLAALDRMRGELSQLHSRKLRSFDEPPFR